MVDLATQYRNMQQEVDAGLREVLDSTAFINGAPVKAFAEELAAYLGVKHVIPCANGTDALQMALMALELQPGDEVITTPFTFVATAEVIALLGLKPVFADVEPGTMNIDPQQIERLISVRTKAIIPVHLFGQAVAMDEIMAIALKNDIPVIEDNAQATGGTYRGADDTEHMLGSIGAIGCTSFYPTKNLGCYGDGGAISTNDDHLAHQLRLIANHGSDRRYYYDAIGVNSRLDTLQAVVLRAKLKRLDDYNTARRVAADLYDAYLRDVPGINVPYRAPYAGHVFHQYTLRVDHSRDELQQYLQKQGVPSMIYYPVPLHISKAYARYGYKEGDFPVTEQLAREVISLPMHSELDAEQIACVAGHVIDFMTSS